LRLPAQLLDFCLQDFASAALARKVLFDTHERKRETIRLRLHGGARHQEAQGPARDGELCVRPLQVRAPCERGGLQQRLEGMPGTCETPKIPCLPQVFDVQVVRQTNEPMRFDGAQIENSVQNRSLQLGHYVWTTPPRPQLAFEGVFKHLLNPVRVRVFFISLHKRAFVSSALLSALQRMQQYIRFGSQIT
jgi:hypothetical protein